MSIQTYPIRSRFPRGSRNQRRALRVDRKRTHPGLTHSATLPPLAPEWERTITSGSLLAIGRFDAAGLRQSTLESPPLSSERVGKVERFLIIAYWFFVLGVYGAISYYMIYPHVLEALR